VTPLPPDLQRLLDEIDDADRAAETLTADLSDQQFHWQPDAGRSWSIAQCLEHLAAINELYGGSIRQALDDARTKGSSRQGPLKPGPFGRWFIRSQEPPVKRRLKTPGRVRPGSTLTRAEILRRYHEAHDEVRRTIRDAGGHRRQRHDLSKPVREAAAGQSRDGTACAPRPRSTAPVAGGTGDEAAGLSEGARLTARSFRLKAEATRTARATPPETATPD
jgi:hypothetical protein